ncbi:MAG: hypothetical protein HPY83_01980 [Anaerolineae bacterium]|nr:hypothetical protein [Anaerolineae bacterium]
MPKLLMRWNIKPGKETDYFEYVLKEFAPGINRLGLRLTESWYTVYGEGPQILTGAEADSEDEMDSALDSEAWERLAEKLQEYVTDFGYKVVPSTGRFQL